MRESASHEAASDLALRAPVRHHSLRYRPDVDGLRALAVLPVVLFHAGMAGIPGGFAGVDVFFVISGYLIAGTVLDDLERGRFSLTAFYWRRARRILPALVVVLLASAVAAWAILLPADLREFGWSTVAAATFWSNLHFWNSTNYFAIDAGLRPLLHTWSLSVEEQYYIVAPVAMWVVHRFMGRRWLVVLVPLIALSFALSVWGTTAAASATFYLLPTRAWELMLGALLMVRPPPAPRSAREASLLGLLGLGLLLRTYATLSEDDSFPGLGALAPCLGALLLIHAGSGAPGGLATRLLSLPPLVGVGLISYSLYLVHWPIIAFAPYATLGADIHPGAVLVPSLLLAWLSWRLVEQPFRAPLPRNRPAVIFPLSGAGIAACALVGWAFVAGDGLPRRFPGFAERAVAVEPWRNGTCFNENGPLDGFTVEGCVHDLGFGRAGVLLWGDSFAAHYVSGLEANAERIGSDVFQYTYAGCPPVLSYFSVARPNCTPFNARALDLVGEAGIQSVVLAARWSDYGPEVRDGLQATVDALLARGMAVHVIGQSPQFVAPVQTIAFQAARRGVEGDAWPARVDPALNEEVRAHARGASFVDPMALLCEGRACPFRDAGEFHFFDYGHFSTRGASRALAAYVPQGLRPPS